MNINRRITHVLTLFFVSIVILSCGKTHPLFLEESDEEITGHIKNLSNEIKEHRSLEKKFKLKKL